jgi:hypothetical protein
MHTKSKDDRTADVRMIFVKTKHHIYLGTGKKHTGHYCLVCKYVFIPISVSRNVVNMLVRNKGASLKACFFSGGISSLCTHIARYDTLAFVKHNVFLTI